MGRSFFDLLRREDGVVAVIFAVMAIPFIAMAGWAVDYVRLQHVKDFLQAQVDSAALSAIVDATPVSVTGCLVVDPDWEPHLRAEVMRQYHWAQDPEIEGRCLSGTDYEIVASVEVPLAFIKILPNIGDTQLVTVSARSQIVRPTPVQEPPVSTFLDSQAGDFNRLWLYCYWPDRPENGSLPKRTQMVPIADNGGSEFIADLGQEGRQAANEPPKDGQLRDEYWGVYNPVHQLDGREKGLYRYSESGGKRVYTYYMPQCSDGSVMSFRLENVRFARNQKQYWDQGAPKNNGGDKHSGRFDYYTDTTFTSNGVENYDGLVHPSNGQPVDIVETVLCDAIEDCTKTSKGGIVPEGTGRTPEEADGQCVSTEETPRYMYYGWEDRPPGQTGAKGGWQDFAWTDEDFDDITVVIQCPIFDVSGERNVRLIG